MVLIDSLILILILTVHHTVHHTHTPPVYTVCSKSTQPAQPPLPSQSDPLRVLPPLDLSYRLSRFVLFLPSFFSSSSFFISRLFHPSPSLCHFVSSSSLSTLLSPSNSPPLHFRISTELQRLQTAAVSYPPWKKDFFFSLSLQGPFLHFLTDAFFACLLLVLTCRSSIQLVVFFFFWPLVHPSVVALLTVSSCC